MTLQDQVRPPKMNLCFIAAKYALDGLNMQKNKISKIVADKKKSSKGQDKCEDEIAESKTLDAKIEE
jgi:seryl-tRNA synthetase